MQSTKLKILFLIAIICCLSIKNVYAQEQQVRNSLLKDISKVTNEELSEREVLLLNKVTELEKRLVELEKKIIQPSENTNLVLNEKKEILAEKPNEIAGKENTMLAEDLDVLKFFKDTTINLTLDGYYGYNFNRPRANLLRAYDVAQNSFTLSQAALILEQTPNLEEGRRFGARLDLQFGSATETLQGNANNELRPQVYRHVLQAYGTYVFPIGSGLTLDFGKFTSALGIEGNYNKDQINYSRSYFFNFLPFYHMGFRSTYNVNSKLTVTHWLVNGVQQTEDFNGFKSQALIINIKPKENISFNLNYYTGLEGRDSVANLNPTSPSLPTQPGLPTQSINPVPRGRLHILDSYFTWNVTSKLTVAGELDYVISRVNTFSAPMRVTGGAAYLRYQFTPKVALALRGVYLSDRGGIFSGVTQALKDTTVTFDYKLAEGFLMRAEYRRDFSSQAFFLTNKEGLKKEQNTATLGLVWWFGRKKGSW